MSEQVTVPAIQPMSHYMAAAVESMSIRRAHISVQKCMNDTRRDERRHVRERLLSWGIPKALIDNPVPRA